jgi:hypothetical protein
MYPLSATDLPEPWQREQGHWECDDGVGEGKVAEGARPENQCGNGNEGIGRVEVAPQEKPGQPAAETSPGQAPFLKPVQGGASPARSQKTQNGDQREKADKDEERSRLGFHGGFFRRAGDLRIR